MYIVLMAGGIGSRFWPMSRFSKPKQLLNLFGNRSMLQMTYDRISHLTKPENVLVITNQELKDAVVAQLPELPGENIIGEPFGKNTAPCIGLACAIMKKREADSNNEVMVVLPADHLIQDENKFYEVLNSAVHFAGKNDYLLTIGIIPKYPETGYGYIQRNEKILSTNQKTIYKVKTFAEKPNRETAERFIKSGDFFWNSGMFVWNLKTILTELEEHIPDLAEGVESLVDNVDTKHMDESILDVYSKIKSESIDYGILEVSHKVGVIEGDFSWNDVGSWEAVHNILDKDHENNVVVSDKNIIIDSKDNYLYSSQGKMIVAMNMEGVVLVETDDAILLCKKDQSQKVKTVVDILRMKNWDEYL
jgi:mannose-1-phosphate guanylyltransferase